MKPHQLANKCVALTDDTFRLKRTSIKSETGLCWWRHVASDVVSVNEWFVFGLVIKVWNKTINLLFIRVYQPESFGKGSPVHFSPDCGKVQSQDPYRLNWRLNCSRLRFSEPLRGTLWFGITLSSYYDIFSFDMKTLKEEVQTNLKHSHTACVFIPRLIGVRCESFFS